MQTKEGFNYKFNPLKCAECGAKCCTGESGYIWLSVDEAKELSKFLNIDLAEFKHLYTYKVGSKMSLKEKAYNNALACVFFDETNKNCGVYDFRPKQCKTFPFWEYFKTHFDELEKECIGVE